MTLGYKVRNIRSSVKFSLCQTLSQRHTKTGSQILSSWIRLVSRWRSWSKMETLCSDPVLVLPIELLVRQIFQWLKIMDVCTCRLVSTRWNRIASLNINNRKELNFAHVPIVSEFGLNSILKITRHLRVVRLDECTKCTNEENLILLAENCPGLRVLTTSRCKWVTDNAIKVLCELCTELLELDFSSCYQVSTIMIRT